MVDMAEIRKHDPVVGNAIAEALRAAMGDPIRPVATWETPGTPPQLSPEEADAATSWVSLKFTGPSPAEPPATEV